MNRPASSNLSPFLRNFLKRGKDQWKEQREQADDFERPDGTYMCKLIGAELEESRSGNPQVKWTYLILEGEYSGKNIWDWNGLTQDKAWTYLAAKLQRFDVDPDGLDLEYLQDALDWIVRQSYPVKLQLKTTPGKDGKNDFQNRRIATVFEAETPTPQPFFGEENKREQEVPASPKTAQADNGEEGEDIEIGSTVSFEVDGETIKGTVSALNDPEDHLKVRVGRKTYTVSLDDESLTLEDDEAVG